MDNSLIKDSFIYSFGSFLTKAFGFFLIPIYTRFLTVAEYGILSLLLVILQLASFVFLLGVSSASMRFYFNTDADEIYRRNVYGNAVIILSIFPIVLFILLVPIFYYFIHQYLPSVPFFPYVFVVLIIGLFQPIQKLVLGLLRVLKRSRDFVIYSFSFFLFQTITIIIAVTFLGYGLKGIIFAFLLANFCFWGIALIILKKYSKFSFSKKISKSLLAFGIPLIPFFIFSWVHNASGRFMLERYTSLEDLGVFTLAAQFSGLLFFLSNALDNSILPYFYETAQKRKADINLGRFTTKYYIFFGLLSMVTLVMAKPLVLFMADPKFHEAVIYIPLLILAGWLRIMYKIFNWSLMYSKKTFLVSALTGITAFLTVGLLFLAFQNLKMGILGVICVMVVVELVRVITGYLISKRYLRISFERGKIGSTTLVLCFGVLIILYNPFSGSPFLEFFINIVVIILAIVMAMKITKIKNLRELISIGTKSKNVYNQDFKSGEEL